MQVKNEAHFVNVPGNYIPHSVFNLSHISITSFDVGQLIPITEPIEILPTDDFDVSVGSDLTLDTLIYPIMDNLFCDIFCFFVPFRVLWKHYTQFEGENDSTPWIPPTTYSMPQITSPANGWECGTIADYCGVPINVPFLGEHSINALKFRGYAKIVKDWFYDENVQTPPDVLDDDATIQGSNGSNYVTDLVKGGKPFVVGKTHDIFTSCLPAPQKGDSVLLPLGDISLGSAELPVYGGPTNRGPEYAEVQYPLHFIHTNNGKYLGIDSNDYSIIGDNPLTVESLSNISSAVPDNLIANLGSASVASTSSTTINDLRLAFQTQRLFELMARGGTRYYEILASQWGVSAPSGLIQRSEYLGGHRFDLKIHTSVQSSATSQTDTPQGNLAGYSITKNFAKDFKKGFTERGFLYLLGCVRYHHSYSQGISRSFKRKNKFDYYQNAFAHIGEQPIYNYQIYAQGNAQDNEVFGYNEYGVDYRYCPNMVTGQMRPVYSNSLAYMHLGDRYNALPRLSSDFIKEDKTNVDRVIAVTSSLTNQIRANFDIRIKATRPVPLYGIPGLIDHL